MCKKTYKCPMARTINLTTESIIATSMSMYNEQADEEKKGTQSQEVQSIWGSQW